MKTVFLYLLPLFLSLLFVSPAFSGDDECRICIRDVTIINFPVDGGVETVENQNVFFTSFGGEEITEISDVNSTEDLSNTEFRKEFGLNLVINGTGRFLIPSLIDSNVHFFNIDRKELETEQPGLSAFVDSGSDEAFLSQKIKRFETLRSGPRITTSQIIASTSEGVVVQITDDDDAKETVDRLAGEGATLISVAAPIDYDILEALFQEAENQEIGAAVNALFEADAFSVADAADGIDLPQLVLSVTPLDEMQTATLAAWAQPNRAIVSTLAVYQGSFGVQNLRNFAASNGTILYGTDAGAHVFFGPSSESGIDIAELQLLNLAFNDTVETYRAATIDPATFWGFENLGVIEEGAIPSFILTTQDPLESFANLLLNTTLIFLAGEQVNCQKGQTCYACDAPINNETADDDTIEIIISVVVPIFFAGLLLIMGIGGLLWHKLKRKPKHKKRKRREFQMELEDEEFELLDSDNDFLEPGDEDEEYSEDSGV